ncbi:hypothetical protein OPV22_001040 [Ensete ventricosum]|uniref:Uncharacterized protein n=1 Tax=Ensete ventricosum TaxID=4639 RepID=A0AAV8QB67_ENSVE|nr:hypothetical protein OPV22_001040 [Ensete ventricosum]
MARGVLRVDVSVFGVLTNGFSTRTGSNPSSGNGPFVLIFTSVSFNSFASFAFSSPSPHRHCFLLPDRHRRGVVNLLHQWTNLPLRLAPRVISLRPLPTAQNGLTSSPADGGVTRRTRRR